MSDAEAQAAVEEVEEEVPADAPAVGDIIEGEGEASSSHEEEDKKVDGGDDGAGKAAEESSAKESETSDNNDEESEGSSETKEASAAVSSAAPAKPEEPEETRDHLSLVFIGHVDAGKSTLAGQILFLTGQVDERTIEKYQEEAAGKAGTSWYLAFIMDTNEEERTKGKTVEVGRAHFETPKRRFTILDAPGHKNYVPNMIGGASQADVGVLVISARKGEFETGFEKGGQTREHAMLAKTLGVNQLVILINKMDDKTVEWSQTRYDEIVGKLNPFLRQSGFRPRDVTFLPASAYAAAFIKEKPAPGVCRFYDGPPLLQILEDIPLPRRNAEAPLRIPILDRMKDAGKLIIQGKVESGSVRINQKVMLMPGKKVGKVTFLGTDLKEVRVARPGENIRISISGLNDDHVRSGFVICDEEKAITPVPQFEAQIAVIDLLPHKPILSPGYGAVFHCHTIVEECSIKLLLHEVDRKTGAVAKKKPAFVKKNSMVACRIEVAQPVCIETFKDFPQLGRFTLRDEGKTIAVGTVTRLPQARPKTDQASA
eukprot:TRINITY_DN6422_c0_g4_i1.p1 TRINITY_DN6422_c0_g4~~TRINITY_DN6422_c0_g4_i1.p1  ORF type:complete len:542 (-),score=120.48 TRINITY_DN6422_c0_g4_i1:290-1915(-)